MNINGITPSVSFTGITNPLRMQKLRQARQTLPTMPCDSVHFSQSAKNNIKSITESESTKKPTASEEELGKKFVREAVKITKKLIKKLFGINIPFKNM